MTLLGKIFTVLILIMSVLFMSFSLMVFSTHKNWHKLVDNPTPASGEKLGLNQQIENQGLANKELEKELEEARLALKREQIARRFVLASLQTQLTTAIEDQVKLEKEKITYEVRARDAQADLSSALTMKEGLVEEVGNLRSQVVTTQRTSDDYFNNALKLTDGINQLRGNKERLQEIRDQLMGQIAKYEVILERNGIPKDDDVSRIPPKLDGVVTKVSGNLIQISLGSDDGLREKHEVDVYRGKTYLGRIRIRATQPDSAVGDIIRNLLKGTIKQGDEVATRLNR